MTDLKRESSLPVFLESHQFSDDEEAESFVKPEKEIKQLRDVKNEDAKNVVTQVRLFLAEYLIAEFAFPSATMLIEESERYWDYEVKRIRHEKGKDLSGIYLML